MGLGVAAAFEVLAMEVRKRRREKKSKEMVMKGFALEVVDERGFIDLSERTMYGLFFSKTQLAPLT